MKSQRFISMLFLLILLSSTAVFAQHHKAMFKNEEAKSYFQQKIFPELLKFKNELDSKLSSDDLSKLNELRSKAKALREQGKKHRVEAMFEDKSEMKDKRREHKEQFKEIAEQLKPIAMNNIDLIKELMEKSSTQREEWRNDIRNIMQKHYAEKSNENKKDKKFRIENKKDDMFDGSKKRQVVRFLLWDGTSDFFDDMSKSDAKNANIDSEVKSFPNPFDSKTNIEFELKENKVLLIEIFDNDGNKVATLGEKEYAKGKNNVEFMAKDYNLRAGTYYFQIKGENFAKFGKLLFSK